MLGTTNGQVKSRPTERTAIFRELLAQPGILQGPGAFDGISARLVEQAGFPFVFMSGFCTSGARLGAPDTGLISYSEMLDTGRNMREATLSIPILADGDTGYGNAVNVKRTVRGYADAGISAIQLEDQAWPKTCGHVGKKKVVSREEAVARVKAACDARDEGRDILIVARTDARQALGLEEALWRVQAFADAGADVIIADALETEEEMRRLNATAPHVYKMHNIIEGGKSPELSLEELQDIGYKLVIYSVSVFGVAVRAMEVALEGLKVGLSPLAPALPAFSHIQEAVGFPEYFREEARYVAEVAPGKPLPAPYINPGSRRNLLLQRMPSKKGEQAQKEEQQHAEDVKEAVGALRRLLSSHISDVSRSVVLG